MAGVEVLGRLESITHRYLAEPGQSQVQGDKPKLHWNYQKKKKNDQGENNRVTGMLVHDIDMNWDSDGLLR